MVPRDTHPLIQKNGNKINRFFAYKKLLLEFFFALTWEVVWFVSRLWIAPRAFVMIRFGVVVLVVALPGCRAPRGRCCNIERAGGVLAGLRDGATQINPDFSLVAVVSQWCILCVREYLKKSLTSGSLVSFRLQVSFGRCASTACRFCSGDVCFFGGARCDLDIPLYTCM